MKIPPLIRRWMSSTFLHVLEVSPRYLLEVRYGLSVHLTSSKAWLSFAYCLFHVNDLLKLPSSFLVLEMPLLPFSIPYIAHWAFLQVYMPGPIHSTGTNWDLGFRPGWRLFHSPQLLCIERNTQPKWNSQGYILFKKQVLNKIIFLSKKWGFKLMIKLS